MMYPKSVPEAKRKRSAQAPRHDVLSETQINTNQRWPKEQRAASCNAEVKQCSAATMHGASTSPASKQTAAAKNELCSYLNLVNLHPTGPIGNENFPIVNRRSFRLKYNMMLKEKKDVERHLQSANTQSFSAMVKQSGILTNMQNMKELKCNSVERNSVKLDSTSKCVKRKNLDVNYKLLQSVNHAPIKMRRQNSPSVTLDVKCPADILYPSPPDLVISAYKKKVQLGEASTMIVKKTVLPSSSLKDCSHAEEEGIETLYKTLLQAESECSKQDESKPIITVSVGNGKVDERVAIEELNCSNCSDESLNPNALEMLKNLKKQDIFGIIGVPEEITPATRSHTVVNDCEFVDLSRDAAPPAQSSQDHNYCRDAQRKCASDVDASSAGELTATMMRSSPQLRLVAFKQAEKSERFVLPRTAGARTRPAHTFDSLRSASSITTSSTKADHPAILDAAYGAVLSCYYVDYCLVIAQNDRITFFQQSGLGMFLESQAMWIPRGSLPRLRFDANYVRKSAKECVLHANGAGVAYVELFCKEHKHDSRKVPGCDVFVVVYHRNNVENTTKCKLLQLNKFTGHAAHVQFAVVQKLNCVTVYYESCIGTTSSSTVICGMTSYCFSSDYQSISAAYEHETVPHPIRSLHIVEDCDRMIVGCNDGMMSFWNAQSLVRTVTVPGNYESVSFKCDRGFIFALQHLSSCLRLTAINVSNFSHKPLQIYRPPDDYKQLQQASMQEGEVIALYRQGRVCWNMESGKLISTVADTHRMSWPCGSWLISVHLQRVFMTRLWKAFGDRRQ